MTNKRVYLDMDGTIANLYGDKDWLNKIRNFNAEPYINAEKLVTENQLLELVNKGFEIGIVSWLAGYHNNKDFDKEVRKAKKEWLKKNFPNVNFVEIHIVKFGTPKHKVVKDKNGILVDDELQNRNAWKGLALAPNEIF